MIYDSPIWFRDLDLILENYPEFDALAGRSVLVTGAGGLICSALVDVLIRYNETHHRKIEIHAAARSEERLKARYGEFFCRDYFFFEQYDANSGEILIENHADYIVHGAGNASPNKIMKEPVETMISNFLGVKNLLDYAGKQSEGSPATYYEYYRMPIPESAVKFSVNNGIGTTLWTNCIKVRQQSFLCVGNCCSKRGRHCDEE